MNENPRLKEFTDSLIFKLQSAKFHQKAASDRFKIENEDPLLVKGAEFIAMMSTLHSCLDVFGQWLNEKYSLNLSTKKLYFNTVVNHVKDRELKNRLKEFSEKTTYLADFCNTVKHRNIVKISAVYYFMSPIQPGVIYDIESFEKDNRKHGPQSLPKQLNYQYDLVSKEIIDITGIDINPKERTQ
ncbi:Cthe_2314 family HEPN domain-containing protein [Priestia filamentosa]|uniref:Cthe_2314 family HEPN domain-containing protein n=1 Tax=Priestia filamentosa TaxID=1402861 RepID=UPI003982EBD6